MKRIHRSKLYYGLWVVIGLFFFSAADDLIAQEKHALLIGINKYVHQEAVELHVAEMTDASSSLQKRNWGDLRGAVNDVQNMKEVLVSRFGFNPDNITLLIDEEATRENILTAIETNVINNPNPGDDVFFFYAGHGSQVRNTLSDEINQMDETIVPSDAMFAAEGEVRDIRDKELRAMFNRALDRELRLTLVFDSCHSGSIARGQPSGITERKLEPAPYEIADDSYNDLPAPEDRGALVLSSAQDFQTAKETLNSGNQITGIFTDALLRAFREVSPDEPIDQIMTRVSARVRATIADQHPVVAGLPERTSAPLFGDAGELSNDIFVAVRQTSGSNELVFDGGLALGIHEGAVLTRSVDGREDVVVRVTKLEQISGAIATLESGSLSEVSPGDLFRVTTFGVPSGPGFSVYIPEEMESAGQVLQEARNAYQASASMNRRWITDPTQIEDATFLYVHRKGGEWHASYAGTEVQATPQLSETVQSEAETESVFIQFPPAQEVVDSLDFVKEDESLVRRVEAPEDADYVLTGRYDPATDRLSYSWVRPNTTAADSRTSVYPVRTDWIPAGNDTHLPLNQQVNNLAKIKGWLDLQSPSSDIFPYKLAVRDTETEELIFGGHLEAGRSFDIVLTARQNRLSDLIQGRYVYVFVIDNSGQSQLLFPHISMGNTNNRVPTGQQINDGLPTAINLTGNNPISSGGAFAVNNIVLLTSVEPISNLSVFQQAAVVGVRGDVRGSSPIEQLIVDRNTSTRTVGRSAPVNWSIDRLIVTSGIK
ncbi:MAG: caspase family protein [Balneolaceae bacterium]